MTQKATRRDYINFIIVMLVFIMGMILMLIYEIKNLWVWIAYVAIWTWIEVLVAKNVHLKWWVWGFVLLGLGIIDLIIIQLLK